MTGRPFPVEPAAAEHQPRTLVDAAPNVAEHPIELAARDHRPDLRLIVEGRADAQAARPLDQAVEEAVVDRALDQQPAASGARLPGVKEDTDRGGVHRLVEVRIREDDDRRLATGLER